MDRILLSKWGLLWPIPRVIWQREVIQNSGRTGDHLRFMTADHHLVRDYVVRELPRFAEPISPERIASDLDLPLNRVGVILDELEAHLTFLFRDEEGAVAWAYPVTVDPTPHRVLFSSGEQIYAA